MIIFTLLFPLFLITLVNFNYGTRAAIVLVVLPVLAYVIIT